MKTRLLPLLAAAGLAALAGAAGAAEPTWNSTLDRISSGVVSIRVDSTRSFDTERNQSSQATGFVVDAGRGLILTNRHVVTPGPVRAKAIFLNQEEVELAPVYRDPVHDFGFFSYDPDELEFIEPAELELAPEAARIGRDIRVIGNDAGEQLSILSGTIARLDRQAPDYGRGNYNDFNTFYLQAASGTSGGSSGSPVVDIEGRVVALNAGANSDAASSFFLPLDRVRVALEDIRRGRDVERGTLQTEFVHKPFAELRRLGLTRGTETAVREAVADETGLLVVEQVLPGAAADARLEPGDILVEVDGELVTGFAPLAQLLDGRVGETVELTIERGGERLERELTVGDLHAITPDEYVEYGDGIFHELSYQQARHFYRPVSGVYVASPGYVFGSAAIPRASLITGIDRRPIESLDDFEQAIESFPEGAQFSVRFLSLDEPQGEKQRIVTNERDWFRNARCARDDDTGVWPCRELDLNPAILEPEPRSTTFPAEGDRRLRRITRSLVLVNFQMPYTVSGVSDRYYYGTGLVVDAERGRVVVDRNTVPVAMGDVWLTFAGSLEIPGRVEHVHPLHNLAVVSYDPELIGDTPVRSAELAPRELGSGSEVSVVGLGPDHQVMSQSTEVGSRQPVDFPLSRTLRFRDTNLETIGLVNGPSDFDGAIVDDAGRVLGLWSSFAYQGGRELTQVNKGMPIGVAADMIERLEAGEPLRSLEVEWRQMPLATARKLNLPESWVRRYEEHSPGRRELLAVASTVAGTPAEHFFRAGDILLAIDGEAVNTFRAAERATQLPEVSVTVFRDGAEITRTIETVALAGDGPERVVLWAGALLQEPHRALSAQRGIEREGVYVAYFNFGSPASRSGLYAGRRVVAVNGRPTPNLDRFIEVVDALDDREPVRINTVTWNEVPEVITLEIDKQYWPAQQLSREAGVWSRSPIG